MFFLFFFFFVTLSCVPCLVLCHFFYKQVLEIKSDPRKVCGSVKWDQREYFKVLYELGQGSNGICYKAVHVDKDEAVVAVKVLKEGMQEREEITKLLREGDHMNVIRYFGEGRLKEQHYVVMDYMGGGTLEDLVEAVVYLSFSLML